MLFPESSRKRSTLLLVTATAASLCAASAADEISLTIYSTARPGGVPADLYRPVAGQGGFFGQAVPGYAMIRQVRAVELEAGLNHLNFRDVAAYIDPTTVLFESLTAPTSTRVVEQSFQFDLVSTEALMEKYIDQTITVDQQAGNETQPITGRLMSTQGGLVLGSDDGRVHAIREYQNVHFPALPGGLITRPTLVWDVTTDRAGSHDTRVTYQTAGLTWWADYNVVFAAGENANTGVLDIGAWVSILNRSGASYPDARLKLIAGDVQRIEPAPSPYDLRMMRQAAAEADVAGFEERGFFEFHLYTLGRSTTLPDNSTKQIELFPQVRGVPAEKLMVYYGLQPQYALASGPATDREYGLPMNTNVDVYLQFDNAQRHGLGIPLPAGRMRVSQLDEADGTLEFIGEDVLDHTPADETVRIRLGSAFDVVGERRQVDFRVDFNREEMEETIEIRLRNHKQEAVEVQVRETMFRWTNNDIVESTHPYERADARTVHFPVTVGADGEAVLTYRVRYTW